MIERLRSDDGEQGSIYLEFLIWNHDENMVRLNICWRNCVFPAPRTVQDTPNGGICRKKSNRIVCVLLATLGVSVQRTLKLIDVGDCTGVAGFVDL